MTVSTLTASAPLSRLALRRERLWIPLTVVLFAATMAASFTSIRTSLGALSQRESLAASLGVNPAFAMLLGPFDHPQTIASTMQWRIGLFMIGTLGILVVMTVVRHTRKEEEAGLLELVGAARTGRLAPLVAGLVAAAVLTAGVAAAVVLLTIAEGSPVGPAFAYGAQYVAIGLATAGTTAVVVQLATAARTSTSIGVGIVLGGYVLRGFADANHGWRWLRWVTPLGWIQKVDPYGDVHWWPVLACLLLAAAGVGAAALIRDHRDLGAGVIQPRAGRARARFLGSELELACRLELRPFLGWLVGLLVFAAFIGSLHSQVRSIYKTSPQFTSILHQLGGAGAVTKVFESAMAGFMGIIVASWAITATSMLRADEQGGRTELLLSTRASRRRMLLAPIVIVVVGSTVMLLATGAVAGSVSAGLVQAPAVWATGAVAIALHGAGPRWGPLAWVVVGWSFLVGQIGALLRLPHWVQNLSPFMNLPKVPAESWSWPPLIWLTVVTVVLVAVGLVLHRRRDIPG